MTPAKSCPHQLLVEGRDDVMAIGALLDRWGLSWPGAQWHPYINATGGIDELLAAIPVAAKASYQRLGVVVDADLDVLDRWTQVRARFSRNGITLPVNPDPQGTVVDGPWSRLEKVGVWLMPNNRSSGMLEDFLIDLVPRGDVTYPIAETSTTSAIAAGAPINPIHRTKGCIHAFLAWQDPPGLPFGTALTAQVLHHNSAVSTTFIDWLTRLYS